MISIAGVVSIVLFYLLILAVGIWAGRKKEEGNDSEEEVMLAGRSIGLFVGIFTMTGELVAISFYIFIDERRHDSSYLANAAKDIQFNCVANKCVLSRCLTHARAYPQRNVLCHPFESIAFVHYSAHRVRCLCGIVCSMHPMAIGRGNEP